jgi:hypothetical protein
MEVRVRQETEEVRLEGSSRGSFRMEFQEQEVAEAGVVRRPGSRPRSGSGSRSFLVGGSLLLKKKKKFRRFCEGFGHFCEQIGDFG